MSCLVFAACSFFQETVNPEPLPDKKVTSEESEIQYELKLIQEFYEEAFINGEFSNREMYSEEFEDGFFDLLAGTFGPVPFSTINDGDLYSTQFHQIIKVFQVEQLVNILFSVEVVDKQENKVIGYLNFTVPYLVEDGQYKAILDPESISPDVAALAHRLITIKNEAFQDDPDINGYDSFVRKFNEEHKEEIESFLKTKGLY